MSVVRRVAFTGLAILVGAAGSARADDADPAVTPYRPSVSTPAALSTPGVVEFEAGGLQARGPGDERRTSVPATVKLAFTPDWGVFVTGEALVHDRVAGASASGGGDTTLVLKHRIGIDDARAFGVELGTTFPTASSAVGGAGAQAWDVNAIYSADFAHAWHTDLNLNETRQDAAGGAPTTWQTGWAAALSRSLNDDWGVVGEFSGTHASHAEPTAQFLVAGSFNASRAAVLDFGIAAGLNRATPHAQVFVGGTFRLGRLF